MTRSLAAVAALSAALASAPAGAADLMVSSAGAVRGLMAQIIDDYSRQTGHKFEFTVGTTGQLRAIIASGWPADLIIVSAPLMAELEKTGNLTPGSRADLGRVGIGVTVRDGTTAPDLSTSEAFKKALVEAKSFAITDPTAGGATAAHLTSVYQRLGVTDIVMKKAVMQVGGKEVAEAVAAGQAELGVTFISEIVAVKGARLAAPLPPALQDYTVYSAAIPKASNDPAAARAFIVALTSPTMAPRWTAAGFEPPK
jgi:molybdate transport system substrate-binding protein